MTFCHRFHVGFIKAVLGLRPAGRRSPFKTAPGGFVSSRAQLMGAVAAVGASAGSAAGSIGVARHPRKARHREVASPGSGDWRPEDGMIGRSFGAASSVHQSSAHPRTVVGGRGSSTPMKAEPQSGRVGTAHRLRPCLAPQVGDAYLTALLALARPRRQTPKQRWAKAQNAKIPGRGLAFLTAHEPSSTVPLDENWRSKSLFPAVVTDLTVSPTVHLHAKTKATRWATWVQS